jgi:hypothetical protein
MKAIASLVLAVLAFAATPAHADRPFGTSNQGPPTTVQIP